MELRAENGRLQPGVGFYPTDEVLVMHYLRKKVMGRRLESQLITEVDIYKFHPEDLRALSQYELFKDPTWYFFCARGRKYGHGDRTNRAAPSGYWKPTGTDKPVDYRGQTVATMKTLVFHQGKSPNGERTNWVMHEYRLMDRSLVVGDEYVVCKITKKSGIGPKNREQHGAEYIEEEWDDEQDKSIPVPTDPAAINGLIPSLFQFSGECSTHSPVQVYSGVASVSVVDQAPTPMSNAADVASSSRDPVLSNGEDALVFHTDEFGDIYGGLGNFMELNDLSEPLWPSLEC